MDPTRKKTRNGMEKIGTTQTFPSFSSTNLKCWDVLHKEVGPWLSHTVILGNCFNQEFPELPAGATCIHSFLPLKSDLCESEFNEVSSTHQNNKRSLSAWSVQTHSENVALMHAALEMGNAALLSFKLTIIIFRKSKREGDWD